MLLPLFGPVGCGGVGAAENGGGESSGESTLTVFAASSLTDAFEELGAIFEDQNPGTEVRFSFAGSSTLLAQIRHGAPADVFASADKAKMNAALDDGLVAETPKTFARNRLVLIVPSSNPAGIESYGDLAKPGVRFVLAQDGVPVAEYAKQSLRSANAEYGKNFSGKVLSSPVSREADVRAAASRVALGDADATFVYSSDVTGDIRNRVKMVEIPEKINLVATYPMAPLGETKLGRRWIDLVRSAKGQRVMEKWGFEPAG